MISFCELSIHCAAQSSHANPSRFTSVVAIWGWSRGQPEARIPERRDAVVKQCDGISQSVLRIACKAGAIQVSWA